MYPRQYVAYYTDTPPVFDGRLDDPVWQEVGASEPFVDISTATRPEYDTTVKVRWDDTYLYIGAWVQDPAAWANITHACHCISPANQVIYTDNDFEIFVDADGSNAYYKETEINAANATWDLLLNRTYTDGGEENSTRVFGPAGFDMWPPAYSATYCDGALNNPRVPHSYWSVELALPLAKLAADTTASAPPVHGAYWRINFSRVEWATAVVKGAYWKEPSCQSCPVPGTPTEDNWVWSPMGAIAMHQPNLWGFLQFSTAPVNTSVPVPNPQWPLRSVAMALYYAQHAYADAHGAFTSHLPALLPYTPTPWALNGTCTPPPVVTLSAGGTAFNASLTSYDGAFTATITDQRVLYVHPPYIAP